MGMFDKDREMGNNLANAYALNTPFVLVDARMSGETVPTRYGDAEPAELVTMRLGADGFVTGGEIVCRTVASAIVAKVAEAEPGDFPAVVELQRVPSKRARSGHALVLQFIAPYYPEGATVARAA